MNSPDIKIIPLKKFISLPPIDKTLYIYFFQLLHGSTASHFAAGYLKV
jgi:hypothetical protein